MKIFLLSLMALAFLVDMALSVGATEVLVVNQKYVHGEESFLYAVYSVPAERGEVDIKTQVLAMLSDEGISSIKADRIITCESTWNPKAVNHNRNGSNDMGIWQLNSVHGLSDEFRLDPVMSTKFAISLIKKKGFQPWVCQ